MLWFNIAFTGSGIMMLYLVQTFISWMKGDSDEYDWAWMHIGICIYLFAMIVYTSYQRNILKKCMLMILVDFRLSSSSLLRADSQDAVFVGITTSITHNGYRSPRGGRINQIDNINNEQRKKKPRVVKNNKSTEYIYRYSSTLFKPLSRSSFLSTLLNRQSRHNNTNNGKAKRMGIVGRDREGGGEGMEIRKVNSESKIGGGDNGGRRNGEGEGEYGRVVRLADDIVEKAQENCETKCLTDRQKKLSSARCLEFIEKNARFHDLANNNPDDPHNICLICFGKTPDAIFMPCGHGGVCYDCASVYEKQGSKCYMCRQQILHIYQITAAQKSNLDPDPNPSAPVSPRDSTISTPPHPNPIFSQVVSKTYFN